MKLIVFATSLLLNINIYAQSCAPVVLPTFTEAAKKDFEAKLAGAKAAFDSNPKNADAITWYGRRLAYLGYYEAAIEIFTKGIALHPDDARIYRHRGHRYITLRCFDKAIADFAKAAALIKNKPDEIEPDGLPNAQNIPTSTLQSNIWYHLGLAYYLKGNFDLAVTAYREGLKVSTNQDMYVATANWLNLSLRRSGSQQLADALLQTIDPGKKLIENEDYLKIIQLFRNKTLCTEITSSLSNTGTLSSATFAFGAGSFCLLNKEYKNAISLFKKIIAGNQWSSFAYIAAEQELKRLE